MARSFCVSRSICSGSSPTIKFAELVNGSLQCGAERAAEKTDTDSLDTVFGFYSHCDELVVRTKIRRPTRQRFIQGHAHHLGSDTFEFHGSSILKH